MVTGQQVFNMALALMDEVTESGTIASESADNYKAKALVILTQLHAELSPITSTPVVFTNLSQQVTIDDRIALLALPYGLASQLLLIENNYELATFYNNQYEEMKKKKTTKIEKITDVYGVKYEVSE